MSENICYEQEIACAQMLGTNLSIKVITVVNEFTICLKYKSLLCFLQHGHVSIWDSISFYYLINISEVLSFNNIRCCINSGD